MLKELNLTAEQLLANKPLLTDVLTYHVLPQKLSLTRGRRIQSSDCRA